MTSLAGSGPPINAPPGVLPREFWVVDWSGSERARALLARWVARARFAAGDPAGIVAHAPGGSAAPLRSVLPGLAVLDPVSFVGTADRDAIHRWVSGTADDVMATGAFPVQDGVDFGRLNLLDLQDALERFATFRHLVERGSHTFGSSRVRLFTFDAPLAGALGAAAAGAGLSLRGSRVVRGARALQGLLLDLRSPNGGRTPSGWTGGSPPLRIQRVGAGGALAVSWTRPMLEMFDRVGPAVRLLGRGWLNLHYGEDTLGHDCVPGDILGCAASRAVVSPRSRWRQTRSTIRDRFAGVPERRVLEAFGRNVHRGLLDLQSAHIRVIDELLDAADPGIVVVGNDRWWVGQSWVERARSRGIPTLCVQDGIASVSPQWNWITADRIALMGANVRDALLDAGVDPERTVLTGQPRYDGLLGRMQPGEEKRLRDRLAVPDGLVPVLFATQYTQDPGFVTEVSETILADPRAFLLLRPHPSESDRTHRGLATRFGPDRVIVVASARIEDLLVASEVVVAQHSTVALEADLLGRRVIIADFSGLAEPEYLLRCRALRAGSAEELGRQVDTAIVEGRLPPGGPDGGDPCFGPADGNASRRVAGLVDVMLPGVGSR